VSDKFVAEIRIFPFQFAPTGWAFCNGQLLPISQNTALFSLLGTTYGGDGKSTFALPDMQGNAALHAGQGQGLSQYVLGQTGGSQVVTLLQSEMPAHNHALQGTAGIGTQNSPTDRLFSRPFGGGSVYRTVAPNSQMAPEAVAVAGGGLPHNNMMPYLTMNFCIALQGIFPPRS